jgi:hypothetical protein
MGAILKPVPTEINATKSGWKAAMTDDEREAYELGVSDGKRIARQEMRQALLDMAAREYRDANLLGNASGPGSVEAA